MITHGFLVSIEAEEGTPADALSLKLADACRWLEGVGDTDVEYMGEIEQVKETV